MIISIPSNELACQALFLHAADEGRGTDLFGENWQETLDRVLPFVKGVPFPVLYLEFPLAGDPYLDVTALYSEIESGTRFRTEAAAGTEKMIDWFTQVSAQHDGLCFGFELDSNCSASAPAAVHFQNGKAYISITDRGETIPEAELPMIFDRFHKSDRSRSLDRDGVGLGLYIVKTILDQMGEDIWVRSKDGETEFRFSLTIAD